MHCCCSVCINSNYIGEKTMMLHEPIDIDWINNVDFLDEAINGCYPITDIKINDAN